MERYHFSLIILPLKGDFLLVQAEKTEKLYYRKDQIVI